MKRLILLTIALAAALSLLSCGEQTADDTLMVVTPHWEGILNEFGDAFEAKWQEETGRTLEIVWLDQGGTSAIRRFIESQYQAKPDGIGVDLFFGGGVDPHIWLKDAGFAHPYKLPDEILDRIPASFGGIEMYDPDGAWYGATMSGFGIIFNRSVARAQGIEPPRTWEDTAEPEMKDWVFAGDPRSSGSVHMAYEIILQAYGWEKGWQIITAMAANSRSFARSSSEIPRAVTRGDALAGMCIDFYAWTEVARAGDQIGFVYPENHTAVNPDAISILRGAPHLEIAERFVRFVMSEEGQRIWAFKKGAPGGPKETVLSRFTVMPDLYERYPDYIAVDINPFEWEMTFHYDAEKGSVRWNVVNDLIGTLCIDSQMELDAAWEALIYSEAADDGIAALAVPPISEEEGMRLAERWREDQGFRNAQMSAWTQFAREKYTRVKDGNYEPLAAPRYRSGVAFDAGMVPAETSCAQTELRADDADADVGDLPRCSGWRYSPCSSSTRWRTR